MGNGELGYVGGGCHFCGAEPLRLWCRLTYDPASIYPPGIFLLCQRHLDLLKAAGKQGRVHAATGRRWWLVWPKPED